MNLETIIDSRLWREIQKSYDQRNYSAAIKDSIYFLSDLIREKSGLEGDGVSLIGRVFGGKNPKLKINRLRTDSEKDEQKGIEQILRGIYQGIRNPRSHGKWIDSEENADAIIIFIDYLLKTIDKSKSPFTKSDYMRRIFDPDFPMNKKYSDLLVKEIPEKHRCDLFIEAYRIKEKGEGKRLKFFFSSLFSVLTKEELTQVYNIISDELNLINDKTQICQNIKIIPSSRWKELDEISRIRIEQILIESVKDGRHSDEVELNEGWLGTWITNISDHFHLKDELASTLATKLLSSDITEQNYVFKYFSMYFIQKLDTKGYRINYALKKGLRKGDKRFYNALECVEFLDKGIYDKELEKLFDNFTETMPTPEVQAEEDIEDDLPF